MKRYFSRPRKGQSLVEFALLLPVFVLAIVLIFDLGRAIYYYSAIHNAAREGARYGVVYPNDAPGIKTTTVNYAFGLGLDVPNVSVGRGDPETVGGFSNPTVRVIVKYTFTPATPLVEGLLPDGKIRLKSEAIMRTEIIPSPTLALPPVLPYP